jgi:hypothetical protein
LRAVCDECLQTIAKDNEEEKTELENAQQHLASLQEAMARLSLSRAPKDDKDGRRNLMRVSVSAHLAAP